MIRKRVLFTILALLWIQAAVSQKATIYGKVLNNLGEPLAFVNVSPSKFPSAGTTTDVKGSYKLTIPPNVEVNIIYSYVGYSQQQQTVVLKVAQTKRIDITMEKQIHEFSEFEIAAEQERASPMMKLDPKIINKIPSASGNFEALLFSQPGVISNNELSSQYSVRGGNFDENLVYVNDIEIYRPFLIRSGQQEGLSFVNSDLTQSVLFSAGGFESRYGDKMSSVLDITYKTPRKFAGSVSMSLLGGAVHLEGASKDYRFTQLHGFRYKTNQYLLGSLDTEGSYAPAFLDYQTLFTYDVSEKVEVGVLGNISMNQYNFIPETRQSEFGTINQALRLTVYFDGKEIDEFKTYLGAAYAKWKPRKDLELKLLSSIFQTQESETFDIQGQYWLDELERDIGKDNFGDVAFNRGVGTYLHHARNYLEATIFNVRHIGKKTWKNRSLLWGIKYQHEYIDDQLSEWKMLDSAGYSLPHPTDTIGYTQPYLTTGQQLQLKEVYKAKNTLRSNRVMGYLQKNITLQFGNNHSLNLTGGLRFNYWDFNNEFLVSPRVTASLDPNWKNDVAFRFAFGYYQQPPFYREMRNLHGQLNRNIKAQTAIHYVGGLDWNFKMWGRPMKFIMEGYYKKMHNLIPYEIDNVRIRYYAQNNAEGEVYGVDLKLAGELVKGVDSWASVSIMNAHENINNDSYTEYYNSKGEKIIAGYTLDNVPVDTVTHYPGHVPRPTDQRVTLGLFFQDYIPKLPNFKMHLNLLYGTGLPFGPPSYDRYKDTLRLPAYRRVDIGFSALLFSEKNKKIPEKNFLRKFKSIWASIEVFNLFGVDNTISYLWIKDVTNNLYAVPNYLTARRVNVKLVVRF